MTTQKDEARELADFVKYIEETEPFAERLVNEFAFLQSNQNIAADPKATFELWGRTAGWLQALAEIDPPDSVMRAHIKLTQSYAYLAGSYLALMQKDLPKANSYLAMSQKIMSEITPLLEPMNRKFKQVMSPLTKLFKQK